MSHFPFHSFRLLGAALAGLLTFAVNTAEATPQAQLRVERGPYHVAEPIEIHVQITGLERQPEPRCEADAPANSTLTLLAIVPNVSSSMQIINGQITRSESVTFLCQYQFITRRPGLYRLKPFRVVQAGTLVQSSPYSLRVQETPLDPRVKVRIELPSTSVYIGQQIPVRIEWWLDESLQEKIRSYSIRSPLFDAPDTFRFLDDEVAMRGDSSLEISTSQGKLALKAEITPRTENGRRYLVVSAERQMVALRPGEYELAAASVNVDEVTRWQRDLFGSRRPAATNRLYARDQPLELIVQSAPTAGRPAGFGGAVGSGFSLEVIADRSVVRLGDPIALTLIVRGDGYLATVGLPPLTGRNGLPPEYFRLSEGDLSGEIVDGAKRFRATVRVLDEGVLEIPAIEYAWFDPELGAYQTTRSRPIALSVRPAHVISADDVVTQNLGTPAPASDETASANSTPGPEPGASGSRSLIGADLSIERRIERLRSRPRNAVSSQIALYTGGIAMLMSALVWRHSNRQSPRIKRLRAIHRAQRARIDAATKLPRREALAEIASALREFSSADESLRSPTVEAFLRECDEVSYAPTSSDDPDTSVRIARARELADTLAESIR